jgi:hypothetical protein
LESSIRSTPSELRLRPPEERDMKLIVGVVRVGAGVSQWGIRKPSF